MSLLYSIKKKIMQWDETMFQSDTMKIFTPPLPPPQSMLFFQYTHHGTRKPNAQYVPTLSRGRGGFAFGNKMYI